MPKFKPNTSSFRMQSPLKTKLGRWLMGRKKHEFDGETFITDKKGRVVKHKKDGVTTRYSKKHREEKEKSLTPGQRRSFY